MKKFDIRKRRLKKNFDKHGIVYFPECTQELGDHIWKRYKEIMGMDD